MRFRAELLLLLVFMPCTSLTREARANPRRARAAIALCPNGQVTAAQLLKVLPLELASGGVELAQTSTAVELVLAMSAVDCAAATIEVGLAVLERASGTGAVREIRIEPGPGAARIVAVAMAELVRELLAKVDMSASIMLPSATSTTATSAAARDVVRPEPEPRTPPPPPARARTLSLHLGADVFPGIASAQSSLQLSVTLASSSVLHFEAGLCARYGVERDLRGRIDLVALAPHAALRVYTLVAGLLELELGPRVVAGWIFAAGRPGSPGIEGLRVDGLLVEVWLDVLLSWRVSSEFSIGARAGAGQVVSGLIARAKGEDAVVTGIDGAGLGVALSGAYRF